MGLERADVCGEDQMQLGRVADFRPINFRHTSEIKRLDGPVEFLHVRQFDNFVLRSEQLAAEFESAMQSVHGVEYPALHHRHLVRYHRVSTHDLSGHIGREF